MKTYSVCLFILISVDVYFHVVIELWSCCLFICAQATHWLPHSVQYSKYLIKQMRPNGAKSENAKGSSREQSKKHTRPQINVLRDYMHETNGEDILSREYVARKKRHVHLRLIRIRILRLNFPSFHTYRRITNLMQQLVHLLDKCDGLRQSFIPRAEVRGTWRARKSHTQFSTGSCTFNNR